MYSFFNSGHLIFLRCFKILLIKRHQVALGLVLYHETDSASACELFPARLLGIKMVEAGFTGNNLAVLCKLQALRV
jgi:hypothetical protein